MSVLINPRQKKRRKYRKVGESTLRQQVLAKKKKDAEETDALANWLEDELDSVSGDGSDSRALPLPPPKTSGGSEGSALETSGAVSQPNSPEKGESSDADLDDSSSDEESEYRCDLCKDNMPFCWEKQGMKGIQPIACIWYRHRRCKGEEECRATQVQGACPWLVDGQ